MEKQTKRWIAAGTLTAGAVTAGVVAHEVTKYLMAMALDRQKPRSIVNSEKARQKIRGTDYQQQFLEDLEVCAENLKAQPTQRVEIQSRDGLCLVGHLRTCPHPKRLVVAMHGWRSSWDQDFGMIADFLYRSGCTVLYAEQRGQNDSGGDHMGFGMLERFDCADWANWMHDNVSSTMPMYLIGISMGASTVLMATGLPLPQNVKGVAADCGYTSPKAIWKHITEDNLHMSYGFHRLDIEELCRRKIQMGPSDYTTIEALEQNTIPVLLIHGTDDSFVPVEMTYENYKACRGPRKLLIVPGADHGMSYYVDRENYEKAILDFTQACER